ncbi:BRCA1-A complex subunit RAP80 isoform X2 [Polypterus senegalus]|uniref:BRCA1-A complex subunit RAP80 isoform X2 n=1 Tax=Polypterus senegalus TaxID=55291 RepID=UPI001964D78E|nr:BRCA1-A complex subunit RAP80 isoform X2 [Polypterus senegalus]
MPRKRRTRASKLEETTVPPKKRQRKTSHVSAGTDRETEAEDIKIEEDDTDEDLSNGGNCKTKDTDLSEEDMLNLALKISEEEANRITLQQQAEDEAVKKAIDESLCHTNTNKDVGLIKYKEDMVCSNSFEMDNNPDHLEALDIGHPINNESNSVMVHGSTIYLKRDPLIVLDKLSQDILSSCSESGFVFCSQVDSVSLTPLNSQKYGTSQTSGITTSPVFPKRKNEENFLQSESSLAILNEGDKSDTLPNKVPSTNEESCLFPKNRRNCDYHFIMTKEQIGDWGASKQEETVNDSGKNEKSLKWRERLQYKRRLSRMTEDELVALAMRMSEQETKQMMQQPNESNSEEDTWKSLKEKRNSCINDHEGVSHLLENSSFSSSSDSESLPKSTGISHHQQNCERSPCLLLKKLSNDIVGSCKESGFVICSQDMPLSTSLPLSSQSSLIKDWSAHKSPTFSKSSSSRKSFTSSNVHEQKCIRRQLVFGMSNLSDVNGDVCDNVELNICTDNPTGVYHNTNQQDAVSGNLESPVGINVKKTQKGSSKEACTVHYYWGIPFCPKGLNPDDYTKIILCQLEVYEKSLKDAQRDLFHKAEWGEPVLPEPPEHMNCKRPRSCRLGKGASQKQESICVEKEPEEDEVEVDVVEPDECENLDKERNRTVEQEMEEEKSARDTQTHSTSSSYRVQHFALPASPLLFNTEDTGEHEMTPSVRCDIMEENSSQHKGNDETEESEVCPESLISEEADPVILKESSLEVQEGLVLVNDDDYGNDKVGKSTLGNRNDNIECPICRKSFPPQHIELHAAYCDGIEEIVDVEETIPKVKSSRRSSRKPDSLNYKFNSSSVKTSEKCFICQSWISLTEYNSHVDKCIIGSTKGKAVSKERLLTALEQTELQNIGNADVGPSHSFFKENCTSISIHSDDDDDDGDNNETSRQTADKTAWSFTVSDSPIKSFVPISQATDCLIDFKQQFTSKRGKRGVDKARKRRFK